MPALSLLLLLPALTGCTLVDQTTFQPEPEAPPPAQSAGLALPETRAPLVTIGFQNGTPDYEDALRTAVEAAEQRRPGTEYDVVAIVPRLSDPPSQATLIAQGRTSAANVARDIGGFGVSSSRIRLSARIDPAAPFRQVLVYVR